MYFKFTIRLLELEGVSSKLTYLGMVEQVITENDNYQQVACENCGGVIMKVILMKLEITQLHFEYIVTYNISYKVSRKLARFDEPQEYTVHG